MGEGARVVDYGKDIADLRAVVVALQRQVADLQGKLEEKGILTTYCVAGWPDGFQTKHNY